MLYKNQTQGALAPTALIFAFWISNVDVFFHIYRYTILKL
ncbi:hypothetical protein PPAR_b0137 [Pseudoalteromonas paragorgicola KMM 3548]|nr:hypothetical protein [Pseudoalteromonas distincta KMM 3548]